MKNITMVSRWKNKIINTLYYIHAKFFSYFWLPCPLCKEKFSGYQWSKSGYPCLLTDKRGSGTGVCINCINQSNLLNKLRYGNINYKMSNYFHNTLSGKRVIYRGSILPPYLY